MRKNQFCLRSSLMQNDICNATAQWKLIASKFENSTIAVWCCWCCFSASSREISQSDDEIEMHSERIHVQCTAHHTTHTSHAYNEFTQKCNEMLTRRQEKKKHANTYTLARSETGAPIQKLDSTTSNLKSVIRRLASALYLDRPIDTRIHRHTHTHTASAKHMRPIGIHRIHRSRTDRRTDEAYNCVANTHTAMSCTNTDEIGYSKMKLHTDTDLQTKCHMHTGTGTGTGTLAPGTHRRAISLEKYANKQRRCLTLYMCNMQCILQIELRRCDDDVCTSICAC